MVNIPLGRFGDFRVRKNQLDGIKVVRDFRVDDVVLDQIHAASWDHFPVLIKIEKRICV